VDKKNKKIIEEVRREMNPPPIPETPYDKVVDKLIDEKTELYNEIIKLKRQNHRLKKQLQKLRDKRSHCE